MFQGRKINENVNVINKRIEVPLFIWIHLLFVCSGRNLAFITISPQICPFLLGEIGSVKRARILS